MSSWTKHSTQWSQICYQNQVNIGPERVQNYKHYESANFKDISEKFNTLGIYTSAGLCSNGLPIWTIINL
jgi:hypothetical protein